jgi:hypothetical protein
VVVTGNINSADSITAINYINLTGNSSNGLPQIIIGDTANYNTNYSSGILHLQGENGIGNFRRWELNAGAWYYGQSAYDTHSFKILDNTAGDRERLRIDQNGNVGISTSTPIYPLDVNGIGRFSGNLIIGGSASISGAVVLGSTASISGAVTIGGSESITGSLYVGSGVVIGGSESITGSLYVGTGAAITGSVVLGSTASISGTLNVGGSESVGGSLVVGGNVGIANDLIIGGDLIQNTTASSSTGTINLIPSAINIFIGSSAVTYNLSGSTLTDGSLHTFRAIFSYGAMIFTPATGYFLYTDASNIHVSSITTGRSAQFMYYTNAFFQMY